MQHGVALRQLVAVAQRKQVRGLQLGRARLQQSQTDLIVTAFRYVTGHQAARISRACAYSRVLTAIEQLFGVELGVESNTIDVVTQLYDLFLDFETVAAGERIIRSLNGKLTHAVQDTVSLVESTFGRLNHRDSVLGVHGGTGKAAHLAPQFFTYRQPRCVIGSTVDPQARTQSFD